MNKDVKNLLQETLGELANHDKTEDDVMWVGSRDGKYAIHFETFAELAKDLVYDSGFGGSEIADDLVVVGEDWWLERHEYDGSEWWEYKTLPVQRENCQSFTRLRGAYNIVHAEQEARGA